MLWLYANEHISKELLLYAVSRIADIVKAIEKTEGKKPQQLTFTADKQGKELSRIYKEHFKIDLIFKDEEKI